MNLACPSCGKEWAAGRVVCPDCLVALVADPTATVRCRHCGRDWPATMQSCPSCLAELHPDPGATLDAMGRILAQGGHLYRPEGVAPFAGGPACTLLRLRGRGRLAFLGTDGLVEATIAGPGAPGRFELVETGAGVLGTVGTAAAEQDGWLDDQWWFQPAPAVDRRPLRDLAAVALVLAAKVLFGRPAPVRVQRASVEDDAPPWLFG